MQLEEFLEAGARRFPDKVALICGSRRLTYGELDAACNRLAHALIAEGVGRGDRVVILLENNAEAVISIWAVLKADAVFVVINPGTKGGKLAYVLNNCRARALISRGQRANVLSEHWQRLEHLQTVWLADDVPIQPPGSPQRFLSLQAAIRDGPAAGRPDRRSIDVDLAALIYTSGSTGEPKGVMLTHLNMISAATSITTYLDNRAGDVILDVLPLSFDYGLYQVIMAFHFGGTVVLLQSFAYLYEVIETLIREKITGFPIVPTIAALLLQLDLRSRRFPDLRYITNTAAALPTSHLLQLRELFPGVRVYSMYGLTECKRVSYLPPEQIDVRPQSVGRGMPNEEVYLVDEAGRRLAPGSVGQLVVRGAHVMKGYWEMPEETRKVLKPGPLPDEKVLYTGDLFRMDEEGYLYFLGRMDDIIKSRGEKVSPREVEDALYLLNGVAEAAVVGIPDAVLGQAIKAFIVPQPGAQLGPQAVLRHCAAHLETFMVPQLVEIREALPKTSSGKTDKRALAGCAGEA